MQSLQKFHFQTLSVKAITREQLHSSAKVDHLKQTMGMFWLDFLFASCLELMRLYSAASLETHLYLGYLRCEISPAMQPVIIFDIMVNDVHRACKVSYY